MSSWLSILITFVGTVMQPSFWVSNLMRCVRNQHWWRVLACWSKRVNDMINSRFDALLLKCFVLLWFLLLTFSFFCFRVWNIDSVINTWVIITSVQRFSLMERTERRASERISPCYAWTAVAHTTAIVKLSSVLPFIPGTCTCRAMVCTAKHPYPQYDQPRCLFTALAHFNVYDISNLTSELFRSTCFLFRFQKNWYQYLA